MVDGHEVECPILQLVSQTSGTCYNVDKTTLKKLKWNFATCVRHAHSCTNKIGTYDASITYCENDLSFDPTNTSGSAHIRM